MDERARAGRGRLATLMPQGIPLPDDQWRTRHRAMNRIALAHVPVVFVFALVLGFGPLHAAVETLPIAVTALAGRYAVTSRAVREVFTTLALVASSAVLVHLSGGYVELHFHFFVVVALVTLYQQWSPFLVAIAFVALHHGIAGVVTPTSVYNHPAAVSNPWGWAAVHAGFIAMASVVGLANWKLNEVARQRAEDYFRHLYEGEQALVERLREADRVKGELVAAVSHEFRTPLTAILGLATTLETHPETAADHVVDFAGRIRRQGRRLHQLVENILEVERPLDATRGACDAAAVVAASVTAALEAHREERHPVSVDVTAGLQLPLAWTAAQLVLVNLVGNALKFSSDGATVDVRIHADDRHVVVEVSNEGPPIPPEARRRIFEPFVQGDSSSTRPADGVGLGLHITQRVVTSAGGRIEAASADGRTTFRVRLPAPATQDGPPRGRAVQASA